MADKPETEEDVKPKRSIVKVLMFVLAGPVLIAVGFAGGYFLGADQTTPSEEVLKLIEQADPANAETDETAEEDGEIKKNVKEKPEQPKFETSYYEFPEPMTTNLNGTARFLQAGVGIATQYDKEVISNLETHRLALRSDILAVISGFTEQEIIGKEGRDLLAEAIKDALNERLLDLEGFGGVEYVFFSSFVLQ